MDQAKAALKIAETKSEERKPIASASEQKANVKSKDAKAQVILAGAEVANPIAAAMRNGGALLEETDSSSLLHSGGILQLSQ